MATNCNICYNKEDDLVKCELCRKDTLVFDLLVCKYCHNVLHNKFKTENVHQNKFILELPEYSDFEIKNKELKIPFQCDTCKRFVGVYYSCQICHPGFQMCCFCFQSLSDVHTKDLIDVPSAERKIMLNEGRLIYAKKEADLFVCLLCDEEVLMDEKYFSNRPSCNCVFHIDCYEENLIDQISLKTIYKWKCDGCNANLPMNGVAKMKRYILTWIADVAEQLSKKSISTDSTNKSNTTFTKEFFFKFRDMLSSVSSSFICKCPNIECGYSNFFSNDDDVKVIICRGCNFEFCKLCLDKSHPNMSCKQYKSQLLSKEFVSVLRLIVCGNSNCGYVIEQNLGWCEHYNCEKCFTNFCPCGSIFYATNSCPLNSFGKGCSHLGFHAHHKRFCFTEYRDINLISTQPYAILKYLQDNFEFKLEKTTKNHCTMEANNNPCDKVVFLNSCYCREHLILKMVDEIRIKQIDPLNFMTLSHIKIYYNRLNKTAPVQTAMENPDTYKMRLVADLKKLWPLNEDEPLKI